MSRRSFRQLVKSCYLQPDPDEARQVSVYDFSNKQITSPQLPTLLQYVTDHREPQSKKILTFTLDISRNPISQHALFSSCNFRWELLYGLYLQRCNLGDMVCIWLSRNSWPNLQQVSLALNNIGDEGCMELSKAVLPKLRYLTLRLNRIESAGCKALAMSSLPYNLRLYLNQNDIGKIGYAYLRHKFQKVECNYRFRNNEEDPQT